MYFSSDCKHCNVKNLCTKSTTRTITDHGDTLELAISQKLDTPE
ncbi:MAG: hypothetical protein Q4Q23_02570 [Methanobacteriaceae archaeon]|nr:hypothetical protein [Methanobacteriaceae archaeon]